MSTLDPVARKVSVLAQSLAIGLMALLVVGVTASRAEFCEDFDAIVAAAPKGFSQVRGERLSSQVDTTSDTRTVWQCSQGLPGVDRCEVEWMHQTYSYTVHWLRPTGEAHAEVFTAVRELLASCGAQEKETSRSEKSVWLVLEERDTLDIVLTYNSSRVRLSVSAIGFPNPGLE
jgi:hypothetical protein